LITKIISGGQTGVDRAALNFAIERGIDHGGYCPRGRMAEDGKISDKYNLLETDSERYVVRTQLNVDHSDGTLILHCGDIIGGTKAAMEYTIRRKKPLFKMNLLENVKPVKKNFNVWINTHLISTLNIAGPRESESQIYKRAMECLKVFISPVVCDV